MAEGRWLPWKEQKVDIRPTPDYKELAKPLKQPPHGLEWRRLEDGVWELRSVREALSLLEQQNEGRKKEEDDDTMRKEKGLGEGKERAPEFLEHVVMPDDTLVGICLKYKVKDRELRRLNGFVGGHFRMCDVLIIPNRFAAGQQPIQGAIGKQPMTRDDMMQIFRKASQLGPQEARFYLESSAWDLVQALAEWREENRWEAEQVQNASGSVRPEAVRRQQQQLRQLRRQEPKSSRIGVHGSLRHQAISGTSAARNDPAYSFADKNDGSIELGGVRAGDGGGDDDDDALAEARVPLLANCYTSSAPGIAFF
eukprot:g16781.t1